MPDTHTQVVEQRRKIVCFAQENCHVPELQFIRDEPDNFILMPIDGDGIINYVFRAQSTDGFQSIIIKYGEDHFKNMPESRISLHRQQIEYETLKIANNIDCKGAPKPFCLDIENQMIAMEDLRGMGLLANDLARGHIDVEAFLKLGNYLALFHNGTWLSDMTLYEEERTMDLYGDVECKERSRNTRMVYPCIEDHFNLKFEDNSNVRLLFRVILEQMQQSGIIELFRQLYDTETCVIHNDLHTKALLTRTGQFAMIDLELAVVGNPAYDLSYILSYAFMTIIALPGSNQMERDTKMQQMVQAARNMLVAYIRDSKACKTEEDTNRFISQVIGFTGFTMFTCANDRWMNVYVKLTEEDKIEIMKTGAALMGSFVEGDSYSITDLTKHLEKPKYSSKDTVDSLEIDISLPRQKPYIHDDAYFSGETLSESEESICSFGKSMEHIDSPKDD